MTIKEVKIAMTPAEEKTISRLQTRRKRLQKRMTGGESAETETTPEVQMESPEPIPEKEPVAPVQTPPVQTPPLQVLPMETSAQSGGASVRIQATKRGAGIQKPTQSIQGTSKILPTKRHMTVKRKPVMKFGGASISGPAGPVPPAPVLQNVGSAGISSGLPTGPAGPVPPAPVLQNVGSVAGIPSGLPTGPARPQMGAGKRKTRRFKERRMSITVKNLDQTRKQKKTIRRQVKQMDIKEIRKILLQKGMISEKSNPPEKMLRSMMKEYLLLQAN